MNNKSSFKKFLLRSRWRFWEYALIVTGWVFGYAMPIYYDVKAIRNAAFFSYTLYK